jgi:hypothetical protein
MRPATIISILRESHLPFSKNDYIGNRPHTSLNEGHPDGARKPPDEVMTVTPRVGCTDTRAGRGKPFRRLNVGVAISGRSEQQG